MTIPEGQNWPRVKIAENSNFEILQATLHVAHLLKFFKMYKYEMDPTKTLGATAQTWDVGQTDGRRDGQTEWNQYTPQQLRCVGGIKITLIYTDDGNYKILSYQRCVCSPWK